MSTKVNAERVAAGLIVRESAQLLKQMKIWFEYDTRIKVQRTRYKELLLVILRLASVSSVRGGPKLLRQAPQPGKRILSINRSF